MNKRESLFSFGLFVYFSSQYRDVSMKSNFSLNYIKINKECKLNSVLMDGVPL